MLFGRDEQVAALVHASMPVIVISGDSGVGKTSVLDEVVARFEGIAPAPILVGHAPAALQAGLIESLGAAAALIAQDEGTAQRVGRLLVEGGRRLARLKANEIGHAVARVMLGIVRDRVGDNVVDVLSEYLEQVRNAASDDLASRIRQAADPDVIYAIAGLATDVVSAADGQRVLLTLDNIDGLQPDDRARLMDLGVILPAEVSVICAFTSTHRASESILDQYRLAGIDVFPLYGVEQWAVSQWLESEGLPAERAGLVWRETNGYGLAVADAIRLLKAGTNLADIGGVGREQIMRAATREALRELDPDTRTAAYKLSVLAAPLHAPRVEALLEMESARWAAVEGALIDSHLFVPGNPPWFHEQRRLLLREQIRDENAIPFLEAAAAQLSVLAQTAEGSPDTLVQYAGITDILVRLGVADPAVSAVGELDDDALAVLGAVIELTDGTRQGVNGEQALLYARQVFHRAGDLTAALTRLSAAGLAGVASNEYNTAVAVGFGSVEAWLYANGRIGIRLGRTPLPRIASLVFNVSLRGALGSFTSAAYGVGDPSLGDLAGRSVELQVRPSHLQMIRPGRKGPSLLLNGKFGDTPFWAAVAYEDLPERDSALSRVQALTAEPVLGQPVELTTVAAQPGKMLPTRRLIRVFERALGIRIGNVINLFDVQASAGEAISSQDAARQQVVALNLLAELSNDRERQVTGHSAPRYGLLWWAAPDGDAELTAVVANADGVITLTSPPTATLHRLDRVGLAQLAGLAPHQDVGFTQLRAGRQSQVTGMQRIVNEIMRHARKIAKYNQHQPRSRVTLDLESLQALIQEQLDEREAAAQIVAASLGRAMPDGHDVYLLIEPDAPTPCLIPGPAGRGATVIEAAMRGPSPRAYVAIGSPSHVVPASPAQQGIESRAALWTALFAEVFGVTEVTPSTGRHTHLNDAIAELLGHMFNEIWLVDSDIMPSTNP